MKKKSLYILFLVIVSCSKPNPLDYIQHISGYWEIEKVVLADGTEKLYKFNQNIDFFEVQEFSGIRKKVQPKLDGSFIVTQDIKNFSLEVENDSLRIYYKTPLSNWKETIISAKENEMIIKNETGNIYFYKPYEKIQL